MIRRADAGRLLVLAAAWAGLFAVVDPRGAFPLNDDFQYAECARRWLSGGGLHLPPWALSSTISHAVLGALATSPWGASNQALRVWMLVVGLAGASGVYALARRWKAGPDAALLAALTLALSPLYAALSASFHLDVTAAALTLAALLAFLRGREEGSLGWLAASSALVAAAGLSRQTCFLSAGAAAAALALERRLTPRAAAALLLPAGLAAAGFWAWLRFVHGPTWAWESGAYAPRLSLHYWTRLDVWSALLARASKAVQLGALLLSPLAALHIKESLSDRPTRGEAAALALIGGAAVIGWAAAGGLPLIGNTLTRGGLGAVTLLGLQEKPAGWWGSPWLWNAAAALALASSLVLTRRAARLARAREAGAFLGAACFVGAPYAATLILPAHYDRYLLIALPAAAAAFAAGEARPARRTIPAFGLLAAVGLFTAAGLSDYFAWNRARWAAGADLVARGVPPDAVENGFDWDGQFSLTRNLAILSARKPAREIGVWDWEKLNRVVAGTTFSDHPMVDGWALAERYPYRTPLVRGGAEVRLFADPVLLKSLGLRDR